MNRSLDWLRVVAPALAFAFGTTNCLGSFFTDYGRLPTPDVPYTLVNPPIDYTHAEAGGLATVYSLELQAADPALVEYPTIDHENDLWLLDSMFPITWKMQLSIGLGPVVPAFGEGQMHVVGSAPLGPDPNTRVFDLELVQLDLLPSAVADPILPIVLRESPIYESTGVTTVVDLCPVCGAFHWNVDSFFDVFTEISLDAGETWTPSAGPARIVQVPEPNTLALLLFGAIFIRRRR